MSTQIIERLAVELDGRGDPVIMLHGLGGTSNTFTPQCAALAGRYRVIRPDLPGSGRSAPIDNPSIGRYAELTIRAAEVLGVERAYFVGHSLGTLVCQQVAVQKPSLVRGLLLLGPLLEPPDAARRALKDRAAQARTDGMAGIADAIVQNTLAPNTRSEQPVTVTLVREMLMRQPPEGYARTCEALAEARAADVHAIRCPVYLLTGQDDPVAPPSVSRLLAERISGARVQILDRCGHWAMFERAAEVTAALQSFCAGRV